MGKRGDGIVAKHRAGALDRVDSPEDSVYQLPVIRLAAPQLEVVLELGQQLARLLAKAVRPRSVFAAHGRTFLTTASSSSGLKGLMIHPVAHAALPWAFLSSWDSVVSITMGIIRVGPLLRTH